MHFHTTGENMDEMLLCIANGITNIRVMWGSENVLKLRTKAKDKDFICPNTYTASNIFDGNPPVFEGMTVIETPEQARQAVLDAKEKGYDFIKIYNKLLKPQFEEIVKTAKEVGMDVIGHRPVKAILGDGEIMSQTKIMDMESIMYSWTNKGGSNMNCTFSDNKMMMKAQFNLK